MISHAKLLALLAYCKRTGAFTWRVCRGPRAAGSTAGTLNHHGYIQICIDGKKYQAHRLAWFYVKGEWPRHEIDHRDRLRSNNRWRNLRNATSKQNKENTGSEGVNWHRRDRTWRAYIGHLGRRIHLGYFATKKAATTARRQAERILFTHAI